jgi:hypothetical protein
MTRKPSRMALLGLVVCAGLASVSSAVTPGNGEQLVTLCYRNRTIQVPVYLVSRYVTYGATVGPCSRGDTAMQAEPAQIVTDPNPTPAQGCCGASAE